MKNTYWLVMDGFKHGPASSRKMLHYILVEHGFVKVSEESEAYMLVVEGICVGVGVVVEDLPTHTLRQLPTK